MNQWTWAALAAVPTGVVGLAVRHRLARLTYRREHETALPSPGPCWWIPLLIAASMAGLVARYAAVELWPWLLPTAPLAVFGPWLAAIDLDVQRLPDKLLLPMAVIVSTAVIAITILTGDPALAGRAFAGGLASVAGHWILHRASRGGLGYGDIKLAETLGIATSSINLTTINLTTLWWSLMISASAAAIWSLATQRRSHFAYGPRLIAGALTATTLLTP